MNPVLILTRNNFALTKRCVESVLNQDVFTECNIVDNASSDGTVDWLSGQWFDNKKRVGYTLLPSNWGVSAGWNVGLGYLVQAYGHCLVVGNDTVLPPSFYRTLLACDLPFVTGVAVDNMEQANEHPSVVPLEPHPDFSAFLIRRDCWEKVGPFDERMKLYASDCDFHVRAHRLGIPLWKASVPFYHERSSTLRLANPAEQIEIQEQANKDREVFHSLYGCLPGTAEYEALFQVGVSG